MPNPIQIPANSVFSNFTNLYSISKTLRFELVPTKTTEANIENQNIFAKDKTRKANYKVMKALFDFLHRDFIAQSLTNVEIDFEDFYTLYSQTFLKTREKRKESPKDWENAQKEMDKKMLEYRKLIVAQFDLYGNNFAGNFNRILQERYKKDVLKEKGIKCLTEAGILEVLPEYIASLKPEIQTKIFNTLTKLDPNDTEEWDLQRVNVCVFSFKGFYTYFGPFNQTRENMYKSDGTATAIATRLIDENLIRFCDNIIEKNKLKEQVQGYDRYDCLFEVSSYNEYLSQVGIDLYNGTKDSHDNDEISIHSLKSAISKENISIKNKSGKVIKSGFKDLYKVMLNERERFITQYDEKSILDDVIRVFGSKANQELPKIQNLLVDIESKVLDKIWLKNTALSELSARYCGGNNWDIIAKAIKNLGAGKIDRGEYKLDKFIQLSTVKEAFDKLGLGELELPKKSNKNKETVLTPTIAKAIFKSVLFEVELQGLEDSTDLWSVFLKLLKNDWNKQYSNYLSYDRIVTKEILPLQKYTPLQETSYDIEGVKQTQANLIKKYADSILNLWSSVKFFHIETKNKSEYEKYEHSVEFYAPIQDFLNNFEAFGYYNDLRNYSTKKPFNIDKFKLNFENSTLMGGWDVNKETDNTCIIIKNGLKYELIVMDKKTKGCNKLFEKTTNNSIYTPDDNGLLKMDYKLLPGPNKMLPKVAFAKSNIEFFNPSDEVLRVYETGTFKKEKLVLQDLKIMIKFWKKVLTTHLEWKEFGWKFQADYSDISQFYNDVAQQGYKLKFTPINSQVLEQLELEHKIYRFQIKNKDWNQFAKKSDSSKNQQTLYWEALFAPTNFATHPIFKLNGEGEVFKREKSIEAKRAKDSSQKDIFKGKSSTQVIQNERYTKDKLLMHIPITINFSSQNITKFNDFMAGELEGDKNLNYIGVDRGENNLLYVVLVNSNGEILVQKDLNCVGVKNAHGDKQNYHDLLDQKQSQRADAKETWSTIQNIKELKAGYLSLVVYELCKMAVENNALIILENLNYGFKKGRTAKFEKSVYQKFEVALAKKLQYLNFKGEENGKLGSTLNGLQLCPSIDIARIDKSDQWGIINYVPAAYTSKICPLTGWHQHIYLKDGNYRSKFELDSGEKDNTSPITIGWNKAYQCYTFEYIEFIKDKDSKNTIDNKQWKLYAHKDLVRVTYENRVSKIHSGFDIQDGLSKLLAFTNGQDINSKISESFSDKEFAQLAFYFKLISNIRNKLPTGRINEKGTEIKLDVIQSACLCTPPNCVMFNSKKDFTPIFFDSRKSKDQANHLNLKVYNNICPLPTDGDANGAFHIAKLGIK